ncbi:MAG: hybrid sensor histidine kinase/response regulator, partial [Phycisphaerales bacterium]|nr:hybrid sensor histidine kinase/response regulator [Phycisphaerales bacterium]
LALALNAAGLGDWEWDVDTDLVALSPAAAKVYGISPETPMTRESMRQLIHEDDREATRVAGQRSSELRSDYDMEFRVLRPDGRMVWVAAKGRGQYGPDGRLIRMLGVVQDITSRKLAEQDLRNSREERELLLVAEQAARAHAEHASRMKDEFLATLSHELRTPLNAILGWSQILTATPPDAEELHQGLEVIERNARSQAKIIEDLLDMSRIISGRVRLETALLDLPALAKGAIETVHPAADARGVGLLFIDQVRDARVAGDPARIMQILWNLLTNAIKFTPRGGEVRLGLAVVGQAVEINVQDTGEGIRPDFLPFVFDRFRQADSSSTRRHGGLGLGLAIVKELAELHGGSVRAVSEGMAQGSTFTVTLPLASANLPEASSAAPQTAIDAMPPGPKVPGPAISIQGLRVAVVDDEADARVLVKRVLEDRGAIVTTYDSAAAAFDALTAANRPDVLVSDIGMPTEDGYSLIGRVRDAGVNIPAIALTAYARAEDHNRALAAGFSHHLSKPVEASALLCLVARCGDRTQPRHDTAGRAH